MDSFHRFLEHERAGAIDHGDAVLAADLDRFWRHRTLSGAPVQPDPGDLPLDGLAYHIRGGVRRHHHDHAVDRIRHVREAPVGGERPFAARKATSMPHSDGLDLLYW